MIAAHDRETLGRMQDGETEGIDHGAVAAPKRKKRKPCERCGSFAKRARLGTRRLCAECLDRCEPIEREPIWVGSLISGTIWLALRSSGVMLPLALANAVVIVVLFANASGAGWWSLALLSLSVVMALIFASVRVDVAAALFDGAPLPSLGAVLVAAASRFGGLLGVQLAAGLVAMLWSFALVIPGILRSLDFALIVPIYLLEGRGLTATMEESTAQMQGSRGALFFATALASTLTWLAAGALAFVFVASIGAATSDTSGDRAGVIGGTIAVLVLQFVSPFVGFLSVVVYFKRRWQMAREQLEAR